VYITESQVNSVLGFSVNNNGSLTALRLGAVSRGMMPVRAASDAGGKVLYVANQNSSNVFAYSMSDGSLTPVSGSPFPMSGAAVDVTVAPTGKFVFVAQGSQNGGPAGVLVFRNGTLTPVAGSPFTTQQNPIAVVIDPSGKYVYAAAGAVAAFSVDQNSGALSQYPAHRISRFRLLDVHVW
jgi:6-phosphogluconolactonase